MDGYEPPRELLKAVAKADSNPFAAVRDHKNKHRNVVLELWTGALCSGFAHVEHDGPDLVCTLADERRVGVACKQLLSASEGERWKKIEKGYRQSLRADVDVDVVLVNAVAFSPIEEWLRTTHKLGFRRSDSDIAMDWAKATALDFCRTEMLQAMTERIGHSARAAGRHTAVVYFFPCFSRSTLT